MTIAIELETSDFPSAEVLAVTTPAASWAAGAASDISLYQSLDRMIPSTGAAQFSVDALSLASLVDTKWTSTLASQLAPLDFSVWGSALSIDWTTAPSQVSVAEQVISATAQEFLKLASLTSQIAMTAQSALTLVAAQVADDSLSSLTARTSFASSALSAIAADAYSQTGLITTLLADAVRSARVPFLDVLVVNPRPQKTGSELAAIGRKGRHLLTAAILAMLRNVRRTVAPKQIRSLVLVVPVNGPNLVARFSATGQGSFA